MCSQSWGQVHAEAAGISPHAHTDLARHRRHRPLAAPRPRRIETALGRGLHGDECEAAPIALAIVSAKPAGHFTSSPGGYCYGMVTKARASELNLTRTIWGFRTGSRREGKERIHGGGRDPAAGPGPARPGSVKRRAPTQPYTTCNAAMCSSRAAISVAYCVCTA